MYNVFKLDPLKHPKKVEKYPHLVNLNVSETWSDKIVRFNDAMRVSET